MIKEESPPLQITKATKEIEEAIRNMRPKPTSPNTELLTAINDYLIIVNSTRRYSMERSGYSRVIQPPVTELTRKPVVRMICQISLLTTLMAIFIRADFVDDAK